MVVADRWLESESVSYGLVGDGVGQNSEHLPGRNCITFVLSLLWVLKARVGGHGHLVSTSFHVDLNGAHHPCS